MWLKFYVIFGACINLIFAQHAQTNVTTTTKTPAMQLLSQQQNTDKVAYNDDDDGNNLSSLNLKPDIFKSHSRKRAGVDGTITTYNANNEEDDGFLIFEPTEMSLKQKQQQQQQQQENIDSVNQLILKLFPQGFTDIFGLSHASETVESTTAKSTTTTTTNYDQAMQEVVKKLHAKKSRNLVVYGLEASISKESEHQPGYREIIAEKITLDPPNYPHANDFLTHGDILKINKAANVSSKRIDDADDLMVEYEHDNRLAESQHIYVQAEQPQQNNKKYQYELQTENAENIVFVTLSPTRDKLNVATEKPEQHATQIEIQKSINLRNKIITEQNGRLVEMHETIYQQDGTNNNPNEEQNISIQQQNMQTHTQPPNYSYISLSEQPIHVQAVEYESAETKQVENNSSPEQMQNYNFNEPMVLVPLNGNQFANQLYALQEFMPPTTIIEKPMPYPVETIVEKIVEKHIPIEVERVVNKAVMPVPLAFPIPIMSPKAKKNNATINNIPVKVLQNYLWHKMLLSHNLKKHVAPKKAITKTAANKFKNNYQFKSIELYPPPPPPLAPLAPLAPQSSSSWHQGARYIYNTLPKNYVPSTATTATYGSRYVRTMPRYVDYNDELRWRNGHVLKRSANHLNTNNINKPSIEYGFKPPLVPSVEINDAGVPLNVA